MKRIIAITILTCMLMTLVSCFSTYDRYSLGKAAEPINVSYEDRKDTGYLEFLSELAEFSAELTEAVYKQYGRQENFAISPISVFMALAIAADASNGETRQEILDALGVTYEELTAYTKTVYALANTKIKHTNVLGMEEVKAFEELANSIWLDRDVPFKQTGVDSLNKNMHTDVFSVSFKDGEGARQINSYIEDKTHGLINGDLSFDPDTAFVIMNTFYLKEVWNDFGRELSFTDTAYDFKNTDGSTVPKKLLQGYYADGKVQSFDGFSTFHTVTDSNFKLYFILPDDDRALCEVFTEDNIENVLSITDYGHVDDENRQLHHTRVLFPEFKVGFDKDIANILKNEFDIDDIFDITRCDFSNITDADVFCSGVIHKCSLEVNEKGIEGAAVTVMPMATSPGPPPYEDVYHDFVVDRAFGFVLTDPYGSILFSGVINELE